MNSRLKFPRYEHFEKKDNFTTTDLQNEEQFDHPYEDTPRYIRPSL